MKLVMLMVFLYSIATPVFAASVCTIQGGQGTYNVHCDGKETQADKEISISLLLKNYIDAGYDLAGQSAVMSDRANATFVYTLIKK